MSHVELTSDTEGLSLSLSHMLVSNSNQHCRHPPTTAATCSNAMHSGRLPETFCAAPNEGIIPPSWQAAAHQSMEAAAAWRGLSRRLMQGSQDCHLLCRCKPQALGSSSSSSSSSDRLHGWLGSWMLPSLLAPRRRLPRRDCTPARRPWRLLRAARPYTRRSVVSSWTALLHMVSR
jgi:hypothetical protein